MKVKIGHPAKLIEVGVGSKADAARELLKQGYSVSEISKAVPMAYSQVHSIAQKEGPALSRDHRVNQVVRYVSKPAKKSEPLVPLKGSGANRPTSKKRVEEAKTWARSKTDQAVHDVITSSPVSRVSPLKIKGKSLGPCSNCGFEIVGQKLGEQMQLVHTGMSGDEYLATVQFCHAYPKSLL